MMASAIRSDWMVAADTATSFVARSTSTWAPGSTVCRALVTDLVQPPHSIFSTSKRTLTLSFR
ncbi:hypothetical protein SR39_02130 [Methylobacterium radiotolerans]|nr:hypothetical protein SR39_02130 [Methylobacterium radiotolerans]